MSDRGVRGPVRLASSEDAFIVSTASRRSCDIPYPGTKYSEVYNPSLLLVRPQSHLDFTSLRESICVTYLGLSNISIDFTCQKQNPLLGSEDLASLVANMA